MRKQCFIILSILLFTACKKDLTTVIEQPTPLFFIDYTTGGYFNSIKAGDSAYYMETFSSLDSFSIPQYIGKLAVDNIDKTAFEFKFRGNSVDSENLDSVFDLGSKDLLDSNITRASYSRVKVKLNAHSALNVKKFHWTFNGSLTSSLKSPSIEFDYLTLNNFPAVLNTEYDSGCVAISSRCIDFYNKDCYGDFYFTNNGNNNYTFKVSPSYDELVANVIWYIDNVQASTSKEFNHTFPTLGKRQISADIFFKSGCMSCLTKQVAISPQFPSGGCFSDFDLEYLPYSSQKYVQLNSLEINYWNALGDKFSTAYNSNPGEVEILESSTYNLNESGKSTQKVRIKGIVRLSNKYGDQIEMDISEAFIAVGTGQ